MSPFIQIITRDVRLAFRQGGATMLVVVFFVLTITLFPLGVGPESALLRRIAPGVIWVAALLAAMLSLDRLFQVDFEDGSLDQLALAPLPLELVAAAKCIAHWLSTGLPLLVISPLLGVLLNLNGEAYGALLMAMAVGTPSLSLVGAIGAALTVGIRRGGVLLSLLVLPLYIPILIFGVGAIDAAVVGLGGSAHLFVLAAILAAALLLAPWAIAGALRLNLG